MGNLEIREFSQAIINFVNQSPLPIEVKRLALSDILSQIEPLADNAVKAELATRTAEEDKQKEEQDHGIEQAVQPD